jgi:hypothetical protein
MTLFFCICRNKQKPIRGGITGIKATATRGLGRGGMGGAGSSDEFFDGVEAIFVVDASNGYLYQAANFIQTEDADCSSGFSFSGVFP